MTERKVQSVKRKTKTQKLKLLTLSFNFTLCLLSSFTLLAGCQNQQLYKDSRVMMGTFVEVTSPDKKAVDIAFAEIKRIENLLSKYDPDSEVAKLNKSARLIVSSDTFYVIKKAKDFWLISNGAFDITVSPLMDLWGFTDKRYYLPTDEEIKSVLNLVGSDKIILHEGDNVIEFSLANMQIDLGAIAKGYAVDCAIKRLIKEGIRSCLINAGGDIYCLGDRFGRPWKVAIRDPRRKGISDYLELKDEAIATSGDYEQYFIEKQRRYSHIFNPKTGYPADSGLLSVTVIASDCLTADALATSIFVLGKEKGRALLEKFPEVKVKIIEKN